MFNERNIAQNTNSSVAEAVGMNINDYLPPLPDFRGQVSRLNLREGFDLSVYDIHADQPLQVDAGTEPCVSINVLLTGGGSAQIHAEDMNLVRVPYLSETIYVCVMHDAMRNTMQLPVGTVLKGIDIRLGFDLLQRLTGAPDLAQLATDHPWHLSSGPGAWIGYRRATYPVLTHAEYVVQQVLCEQPNDLAIESKVLEILSTIFTQFGDAQRHIRPSLSSKQLRLVTTAQQLLLNDIAHPWTVRELARRTGLNEKALKIGFKHQFGQPIFRYLQHERLQRAKSLLEQTDCRVTDAALQVGYANSSHFAYLFRRQFGLSPSQALNNAQP